MKKRLVLLFGMALIAAGCQRNEEPQKKEVPQEFKSALMRISEQQHEMHAALSRDDLPKAKEVFHSMHGVLHMMPSEGLDAQQKAFWDSTDSQIMSILHPLAATQDVDSARSYSKAFGSLMKQTLGHFGLSQEKAGSHHHSHGERMHGEKH